MMTVAAPPSAADAATMDVLSWLGDRVRAALVDAFGPEFADADPLLAPATAAGSQPSLTIVQRSLLPVSAPLSSSGLVATRPVSAPRRVMTA